MLTKCGPLQSFHPENMSKKPKPSDFVIRQARNTDFGDVINLVRGLYFDTDTLPAEYHKYLQDPHRFYYVAVYRGKVVAFTGGRVTDNGETFEPGAARTLSQFQNQGLYQMVRERLINEGVLPKWPQVERIRMVTSALEKIKRRSHFFAVIPNTTRIATVLLSRVPKEEFLSAVCKLEDTEIICPQAKVIKGTETDLEFIFKNTASRRALFPSDVIIKDSESYSTGAKYLSNIAHIMGDHRSTFYVSNGEQEQSIDEYGSVSFGTGIGADVSLRVLRYCIDYYGDAEFDPLFAHFMKHLDDVKSCMVTSNTATMVTIQLILPVNVYESVARRKLQDFVSKNHDLTKYHVGEKHNYTQLVCDNIKHPHTFISTRKNKL